MVNVPRDPRKLCCHCLNVTFGKVEETVRAHGCRSVAQVTELCRAGGGCRSCHPDIEDIIRDVRRETRSAGLSGWLQRLFSGGNGT